jgi:hypothetical protein
MVVHRKFVMETMVPVCVMSGPESKTLKFTTYWVLLFNDMLFFATGSKVKSRLQYFSFLHTIWIQNSDRAKGIETMLELEAPEDCTYMLRFPTKADKAKWVEQLTELMQIAIKNMGTMESRVFQYQFSHGGKYEGGWINAKMHGEGTFTFPNGNVYKGNWKDGMMDGVGVMTYNNGAVYEGSWKQGLQRNLPLSIIFFLLSLPISFSSLFFFFFFFPFCRWKRNFEESRNDIRGKLDLWIAGRQCKRIEI